MLAKDPDSFVASKAAVDYDVLNCVNRSAETKIECKEDFVPGQSKEYCYKDFKLTMDYEDGVNLCKDHGAKIMTIFDYIQILDLVKIISSGTYSSLKC